MKYGYTLIAVVCLALALALPAYSLEFAADMIVKHGNSKQTGNTAMKGEKMRTQMTGQPSYTIVRPDRRVTWMVMPAQRSYLEMKYDPNQAVKAGNAPKAEVSRKLIGSETVNGYPAKKYEVTVKTEGKTERIFQWIAAGFEIPVKTAAVDGSWSTEYLNIKKTAADSLFEVPAGYSKMSMPAMPGMPKMPRH
ncbi:MAG: hypothetical protein A4E72_00917 [Syntrophus sp. PtaU1.Bin208]|nr:MAG: hypothetical protein A4E72_00917 [Syntrophus sp. PtaU1.Bin208]